MDDYENDFEEEDYMYMEDTYIQAVREAALPVSLYYAVANKLSGRPR